MASTYTPRNRWELIGTGETGNEANWGLTVNEQIGLIEDSVSGVAAITMTDANKTLSTANGGEDEARHAVIALSGGSLTATRDVICPAVEKLYVVSNATTGGQSIVFKTAAGTGITVPNGSKMLVYCDGTNVVDMVNEFSAGLRATTIELGHASDTTITRASAGVLAVEGVNLLRAGDNANLTTIELGHASDTTLARSSAGVVTIEGNVIYRAGGTDVPVTDGGTGSSTAAGAATNLGLGTGDSPQFTAVNIGHATDTTITRSSAGVIAVEGNVVVMRSGTETLSGAKTFSSAIIATAQGNTMGTPNGSNSSPTNTNTNLLLYNNSSTNWSGIGSDTAGNMYFVTGTSSPASRLFIAHDGRFGIKTGAVGSISSFTDQGDVAFQYGASINATSVFYCYNASNTGVYLATGNTSWSASSDERLKDITGDLSGALDRVCALNPIRYTLKADALWHALYGGDAPVERIGLSAQQTLQVVPSVVDVPSGYDPLAEIDHSLPLEKQMLGVRYAELVPELIQAIKELRAEVAALRGGA